MASVVPDLVQPGAAEDVGRGQVLVAEAVGLVVP